MTKDMVRKYIEDHMEKNKITYASIGRKLGVSRSAVQSAMTNKSVTYDKLFEICDAIGLRWYVKFGHYS